VDVACRLKILENNC